MINQAKVILCDADQLDLAAYSVLQQRSFAELFMQNSIPNSYLNATFFGWKYNTPAGKARIAFIEEAGKMVSSVAMYPVNMIMGGEIFTSWHFVEAATLPEARGRGFFKACMQMLIESMESNEMIYVFPNRTSKKGTVDLGFKQLQQLPFYAKLILNRKGSSESRNVSNSVFSQQQDEYALEIVQNNCIMVLRNAAYMNWRYNQHPYASYYSFLPEQNGKIMGNIVVRPVTVKGIKQLLIMEFHAINKVVEKQLVNYLKEVAWFEQCSFAVMFSTKEHSPSFLTTGFIKLPSLILPKKQVLMGLQADSKSSLNKNWFCQTGDWDAF